MTQLGIHVQTDTGGRGHNYAWPLKGAQPRNDVAGALVKTKLEFIIVRLPRGLRSQKYFTPAFRSGGADTRK